MTFSIRSITPVKYEVFIFNTLTSKIVFFQREDWTKWRRFLIFILLNFDGTFRSKYNNHPHTLTSVCIIPLDGEIATRRSLLRLVEAMLLPGGGRGEGGDLDGMIFPRLLPPGEPTNPFTEHTNREIKEPLRSNDREIQILPLVHKKYFIKYCLFMNPYYSQCWFRCLI